MMVLLTLLTHFQLTNLINQTQLQKNTWHPFHRQTQKNPNNAFDGDIFKLKPGSGKVIAEREFKRSMRLHAPQPYTENTVIRIIHTAR